MNVLVVLNCLLAITLADYAPHAHHYPINIPVIGKTGVPLESPEIVHARHAHLSHVAAVKSSQGGGHGGYYGGEGYDGAASNHGGGYSSGAYGHGSGYHGPYAHIVIGPHGVPIDTPEVQHARAEHFAALAKAHHGGYGAHYRKRRSYYGHAQPLIGHNGVPLDTPEVEAAKAAHFAAHHKAGSGFGGGYAGGYAGGYKKNYEAYTFPKLAHDGQPLETPEVVALKHAHFAAHAKAIAGLGAYGGHHSGYGGHEGGYSGGYSAAASHGHGVYHGPIHIPVIGHNGVPVDTPEVQAARHEHLAALAAASSKGGYEEKPYY